MRTVFLSALVGASVSFASYTVQANQTGGAAAWFSRSLTAPSCSGTRPYRN